MNSLTVCTLESWSELYQAVAAWFTSIQYVSGFCDKLSPAHCVGHHETISHEVTVRTAEKEI